MLLSEHLFDKDMEIEGMMTDFPPNSLPTSFPQLQPASHRRTMTSELNIYTVGL